MAKLFAYLSAYHFSGCLQYTCMYVLSPSRVRAHAWSCAAETHHLGVLGPSESVTLVCRVAHL